MVFQHDFSTLLGDSTGQAGDANAMLARDAVITAVAAIRNTSTQSPATQQPYNYSEATPKEIYTIVTQNIISLLPATPVNGVSGVIKINGSTGDTIHKPITIVQHSAKGPLSCKAIETP